jgi:hypothetical protein
MLEEEELDKILLNNICCEITEEVMDLGGDRVVVPPKNRSSKKLHVKKHSRSKSKSL